MSSEICIMSVLKQANCYTDCTDNLRNSDDWMHEVCKSTTGCFSLQHDSYLQPRAGLLYGRSEWQARRESSRWVSGGDLMKLHPLRREKSFLLLQNRKLLLWKHLFVFFGLKCEITWSVLETAVAAPSHNDIYSKKVLRVETKCWPSAPSRAEMLHSKGWASYQRDNLLLNNWSHLKHVTEEARLH